MKLSLRAPEKGDWGTGHGTPVSRERWVWKVWGALTVLASQDYGRHTNPSPLVFEELRRLVLDEQFADVAIKAAMAAGKYDRCNAAIKALERCGWESSGLSSRANRDTDRCPPPEGE